MLKMYSINVLCQYLHLVCTICRSVGEDAGKRPLIPVDHFPARDFQAMRVERWEMYTQMGPKQENCAHGSHMARP